MTRFFFALSFLLFVSCKQATKEGASEPPSQMEQVIAIHDEVMPKMGEVASLASELKAKVDTTAKGVEYEAAMKDLQEANKAMMDWMDNFGKRFDSDEVLNGKTLTDQKKEWLNEEEIKVKELREQINSSMAKAKKLLGKK